jgi:hypothetical protein
MTVSKNAIGVIAVATPSTIGAVFFGPTLQNFAIGGAGDVLNREVPGSVITDRIGGYPITSVERGVVMFKCAKDHRAAGPGGQQIVDIRSNQIVPTHPASRLQMESVGRGISIDSVDSSDIGIPP